MRGEEGGRAEAVSATQNCEVIYEVKVAVFK
jgi:hypothetical protein